MEKSLINIRPLEIEHLNNSNWLKWLSDSEVTKYQTLGYFPQNKSRQLDYLQSKLISDKDVLFAIEALLPNNEHAHIGNVGLHDIDFIHSRCILGIIIGEKEYRGKGLGKHSWEFITNHAFNMLNLHKIYAYIFEDNISSRKCASACGYIQEAKLTDHYFRNGHYHNCIIYSKTS